MKKTHNIPITPQDAIFNHPSCGKFENVLQSKKLEILQVFLRFFSIRTFQLLAIWMLKSRILRCNGYIIIAYLLLMILLPGWTGAVEMVDPTRPPDRVLTPAKAQPLTLTAIFIYPHKRIAIINGQAVTMGDRVGEFTITSINTYSVELVGSQNNREMLQLVTIPIKQKVSGTDPNKD